MKQILVVVDYQEDFVSGSLGFKRAEQLEEGIFQKVREFLGRGDPVFFTLDMHDADYLSTREGQRLPVVHCLRDTDGARLYGRLKEFEQDANVTMVAKDTFASTELPAVIERTCGVPDKIEICGVVTNMCVISNAVMLQANFKNAQISILENLCASFDEQMHNKAIDVLKSLHIDIVTQA